MFATAPLSLAIRSYGAGYGAHQHEFMQLVLPLEGSLQISIAGREARLDRGLAASVERGAVHAQESVGPNRNLIIDLDPGELEPRAADRLASDPLLPLSPEANSLIDYIGLSLARGQAQPAKARLWMPLLLDALLGDEAQPRSRLGRLLAAVEADPFSPWTAADMARKAGLSVSRLHALFREELDRTPRAWLADLRLKQVQAWLADTRLPIAELAYRAGYSDQAALTRAMRKATGLTPAAYRRQAQDARTKDRES